MTFDTAAYKNSVLQPLERDKALLQILGEVSQEVQGSGRLDAAARLDVATLFAIDPAMDSAALAAHFKRLIAVFNKQERLKSAGLLKKLYDQFAAIKDVDVTDPVVWAVIASKRGDAMKQELDEFGRAVAEEDPLKLVTPERAVELAAGMGLSGMAVDVLTAALADHGVDVCPDFEVELKATPARLDVSGLPEFRSIVDVVLRPDQPSDIAVVDELSLGNPPQRMQPGAVNKAQGNLGQEERRVEETARSFAQNALSELAELRTADELHQVVLGIMAQTTWELLARGLPRNTVRHELVKRGIRDLDARRLVAKFAGAAPVSGVKVLADLLADGALAEARRHFDSLPSAEGDEANEQARLATILTSAEAAKGARLMEYDSAMARRDFGAAATAIAAAIVIDSHDDTLRTRQAHVPPSAPTDPVARIDGRSLVLTWSGAGDESITYSVVRTTGAVPANHADGEVLAQGLAGAELRDDRPPIGSQIRYAVFATRNGKVFSDPGSVPTVVSPAPHEFAASSGPTGVSLSWATPPEAAGVVIAQTSPDGARVEHRPTTPGQLTVAGLSTGTKYRFSARAVYLLADGGRRESAAVDLDATPRGSIRAVNDLSLEPAPNGHRATWKSVVGYTVELWALPVDAHVTPGARVTETQLANKSGRRLTLRPGPARAGCTVRELDALPDVSVVVPITLDEEGGLLGTPVIGGSAPSVQRPTVERLGDQLRVSWEWPSGDYLVEVCWHDGRRQESRRVSRAVYNQNGGVRIAASGVIDRLALSTVVRSGAREWMSSPLSLAVVGELPVASYTLGVKRSRLGGRGTVTVGVESTDYRGRLGLVTVLRESRFMPNSPEDGTVVDRRVLDLGDTPAGFDLDLGKVASPFWVRVFSDESASVRLEDPPTTQMRGQ